MQYINNFEYQLKEISFSSISKSENQFIVTDEWKFITSIIFRAQGGLQDKQK